MYRSSSTFQAKLIITQAAIIGIAWVSLVMLMRLGGQPWALDVPITAFIAVPAAVIAVAQLFSNSRVQRAAYIKDYALRFRTDKELSESFHYLVYRYGNELYAIAKKPPGERAEGEQEKLRRAQDGVPADLKFYIPDDTTDTPPERRLDNLLGFFDVLGYDCRREMVSMQDIAGVFGLHLDHFIQRKVISDYLAYVKKSWPMAESFHRTYSAPIPYRYLVLLLEDYSKYRSQTDRSNADGQS